MSMARELLSCMHCLCMMLAVLAALLLPSASAQDSLAVGCDGGDAACELLLQSLNDALAKEAVAISKDSIMYSFEDNKSQKIDTGHSCSSTAQIRSKSATARIGTDISLDLSGDGLSDPFMLKLEVPVAVSASVRVKQRFGVRIFGSCSNTASDSYTFSGGAMTRAKIAVAVDLNPSFGETALGNYEVSIDPIVAVGLDVDDVDLNFKVSGVSPLTAVATFIHGFSSTLFRATTAAFTGDSVLDVFKETVVFDLGVPVGLKVLGGQAGDLVLEFIEKRGEREAERKSEGFALELEKFLTSQVREALGVSGSGKRTFIISKDYQQILVAGGSLSDILVNPQTPTLLCVWSYFYSAGFEASGLVGTVAEGERCTASRVGETFMSRDNLYTCESASFSEANPPPREYGPC